MVLKNSPNLGHFGKVPDREFLQQIKNEQKLKKRQAIDEAMKEFEDRRLAKVEDKSIKEARKIKITGPPLIIAPDKYRVI